MTPIARTFRPGTGEELDLYRSENRSAIQMGIPLANRFKATREKKLVAALIAGLTFVALLSVTLVSRLTFVAKLTGSTRCDTEFQILDSDFDFLHFSFTSSVR